MNITEQIIATANKLANSGKKPTVALIKANLNTPAPLPTIVNVLKSWQHEPENIHIEEPKVAEEPAQNATSPHLQQCINEAIAPLQVELKEIKKLLSQLVNTKQ